MYVLSLLFFVFFCFVLIDSLRIFSYPAPKKIDGDDVKEKRGAKKAQNQKRQKKARGLPKIKDAKRGARRAVHRK